MKEPPTTNGVVHAGGDNRTKTAAASAANRYDAGECNGKSKAPAAVTSARRRSGRRHINNNNNNNNDDSTRQNDETDDVDELGAVASIVPPAVPVEALDEQTGEVGHAGDVAFADIPTRLQMLQDLANLCTLAGAILATLAMASMWKGRYYVGMCLNVAANIADIIDGPIARSTRNRHPAFSVIGCKLDCYSDLVSHFVVPASLLMHISNGSPAFSALAALYVCTGIMRQSYFEVTGRCENGTCIFGMTSDYMVALYSITMHLGPLVGPDLMPYVLSAAIVGMISASLTFSLRSRRYDGFGLLTVTAYNVLLFASCVALALCQDAERFDWIAAGLFGANVLLAYPCYFRFVELNF